MKPCSHCHTNPPSGIWLVTEIHFGNERQVHMALCAQCGLTRMAQKRRFVDRSTKTKVNVFMVPAVSRVELVHSFTRPEGADAPGGLKPTALCVDNSRCPPAYTPPANRLVRRFGGGVEISNKPRTYCSKCRTARDAIVYPVAGKTVVICAHCAKHGTVTKCQLAEER